LMHFFPLPLRWGRAWVGVATADARCSITLPHAPSHQGKGDFLLAREFFKRLKRIEFWDEGDGTLRDLKR
jgi:hypothetical protein